MLPCAGSLRALLLYDVSEEIRLDELRAILGAGPPGREPGFRRPAPMYVRFERPPVFEPAGSVALPTGELFEARLKYYDYGVVSLDLEAAFEGDWADLVAFANRWIDSPGLERLALEIVQKRVGAIQPALVKPYSQWLDEVYYVVHLRQACDENGRALEAPELMSRHGGEIARAVRAETLPLSDSETREVLSSSMSYYPADLLVVGWMAAFVYDTPDGAAPTIQLLEFANAQLLEFRHYDEVLTRVLQSAYDALERPRGVWSRWRLAREAERLNALRLDIAELAERSDNAIKFLSDMFYARAYRLASEKVGVNDYRPLVDAKLRTAGELYHFMVNEFREARAFFLEAMIVLILIIDLAVLFLGK